jgi:hypothetical protein
MAKARPRPQRKPPGTSSKEREIVDEDSLKPSKNPIPSEVRKGVQKGKDIQLSNSSEASTTVNIILAGKPKVGKTTLAGDFPNPVIFDFEQGIRSVKSKKIPVVSFERRTHGYDDVLRYLRLFRDGEGIFKGLSPKPKTIVIDSLTAMCDYFEEDLCLRDNTEALQIQHYNLVQRRVFGIVSMIKNWNMNFVAIVGVTYDRDEESKRMIDIPAMTGKKLGPVIPYQFDDSYRMVIEGGKYILQIQQTDGYPFAGIRKDKEKKLKFVEIEDPTYEKLKAIW